MIEQSKNIPLNVRECPICGAKPVIVEFFVKDLDLIRLKCNCDLSSDGSYWQVFHPVAKGKEQRLIYKWETAIEKAFEDATETAQECMFS